MKLEKQDLVAFKFINLIDYSLESFLILHKILDTDGGLFNHFTLL